MPGLDGFAAFATVAGFPSSMATLHLRAVRCRRRRRLIFMGRASQRAPCGTGQEGGEEAPIRGFVTTALPKNRAMS